MTSYKHGLRVTIFLSGSDLLSGQSRKGGIARGDSLISACKNQRMAIENEETTVN